MKRCLHEKKKNKKKRKRRKSRKSKTNKQQKNQLYMSAGEELNVLFN